MRLWSWFRSWWRRAVGWAHLPASVMYTRHGCHLCEDAWERCEAAQRRYGFALTADGRGRRPGAGGAVRRVVPVVTVNGKVRFRGVVNPVLLERLLRAEARGRRGRRSRRERRSEARRPACGSAASAALPARHCWRRSAASGAARRLGCGSSCFLASKNAANSPKVPQRRRALPGPPATASAWAAGRAACAAAGPAAAAAACRRPRPAGAARLAAAAVAAAAAARLAAPAAAGRRPAAAARRGRWLRGGRPAGRAAAASRRCCGGCCGCWRPALRRLALGAGRDHRQRHAAALLVHRQHPDRHHVADRHHVVGALDVAVGHLADVDQAAVLQADVDEGAEIDDVQHRALQLHARLQVLELEDALLEDRRRQVLARVAAGPGQRVEDVAHASARRPAAGRPPPRATAP